MLLDILYLLGGLALLIVGANRLVKGASALAASLGVSTFVIGLTVVAMGTSAPEATLAVISSLEGDPSISFGNVIGANITNIGVVLAAACMVCPIASGMTLLRREAVFLIVSILAVAALGFNGIIDLGEALVLIAAAAAFNYFVLRSTKGERAAKRIEQVEEKPRMERWRMLVYIIGGLALLIVGSELVMRGGIGLATDLGVDEFTIGLTIVAIGTTMPELAVSISSACRLETNLLLGNVLGSNISNSLLIVGMAGMFSPIAIPGDFYSLALPITLVMYAVLVSFMYLKRKLNRTTGAILFAIYMAYLVLIMI
ncbi:MAG: calcium/sodium antiporter [Methanomassiliicoccales archaeon]